MFFNKAYIRNQKLKNLFSKNSMFLKKIKEITPDLIGFSVVTANYQWALEKADLFKKHFHIPIIFGGPHPTVVPEEVISNPQVDMIALGEAEESLLELMNTRLQKRNIRGIWFKEGEEIIKNSLPELEVNLDKYPFPDEDLFYEQLPPSYRISPSVLTSRGCPFSCTYCGNQVMKKLYKDSGSLHWVRQRSVKNVIAELLWRKNVYKSKHFVFMDDIFSLDIDWLREFSKDYQKKINLPFNCLAHPSLTKEETVKLLKDAGCTLVDFGLQTGCSEIRKTVLDRGEKNEQVLKITKACRKYGLNFAVDCILNLPMDSEKTIKESINFFNIIHPHIINCFRLLYFPGTKIVEIGKKAGLINESDVDMINKGKKNRYSSIGITGKDDSFGDYQKYAFLITCLPLLPKKWVRKIINSKFLFTAFQRIPYFLLPFVKVIVQLKAGFGLIFFSVIKNEMFYFKNFFRD